MKQNLLLYQRAVTGVNKKSLDLFMEDTNDTQVVASVFSNFDKRNTKKNYGALYFLY
jgi:hypothetical protein